MPNLNTNIFPIAPFDKALNKYLPYTLDHKQVYQSDGLKKHILKRHPECIDYLKYLCNIITHPDYIGINPNETGISFELVKTFDKNIQIGNYKGRKGSRHSLSGEPEMMDTPPIL